MANSALNKDSTLRNLNEVKTPRSADDPEGNPSETLKHLGGNMNSKSRQFLRDAQGRASEFYDLSNNWIQENRLITMIGVAALAGVLGFFIGRRSNENVDRIEV
jgi:hypothetical protein